MPELHLLTGAYALDALDDVERAGFERHLRGCDTCVAEIGEFREATAALAARAASIPPSDLRTRVLDQVSRTRQVAPAGHRTATAPRRFSPRRLLVAAAAAVLVAGGAGLGGVAYQGHQAAQEAQDTAAEMARLLADPSRIQRQGTVDGGGSAAIVASGDRAIFAADQLPGLSGDRIYQLWLIDASGIHSRGVFDTDSGSGQTLVDGVTPGASLAISVEPDGGSKQPTTTPLVALEI